MKSLKIYKYFDSLTSDEQKLMFIMTNEDNDVMAKLAKFVFNSMQIRDRVIKIENVSKCFQACISKDLVQKSLEYAKQFTNIPPKDIHTLHVTHARKSLLFAKKWMGKIPVCQTV